MTNLLEFKEKLNHFYAKNGKFVRPILKLFIAFTVLMLINNNIGYDARLGNIIVITAISVIGAFLPASLFVLIAALYTVLHVYYSSPILAFVTIMLFMILYFMFIRFMPKSGYVVLAVPLLYIIKIPFVVPILLGMVSGPIALIPISCGVIVYFLFKILKSAMLLTNGTSVEDMLGMYKYVFDNLMSNKEMILAIVAFGIVLLLTYFIRNLSIDYAFYIAILAGAVVNVLVFLIGGLVLNISLGVTSLIIGSIISGFLVVIVQFFRLNLDYSTVEYTQFEDDDYYYYVKAVPKVKIAAPKKDVKRIKGEHQEESLDAVSVQGEESSADNARLM